MPSYMLVFAVKLKKCRTNSESPAKARASGGRGALNRTQDLVKRDLQLIEQKADEPYKPDSVGTPIDRGT